MRGGRGRGLPPPANPDNVAAGGATDARCGEGGSEREGGGRSDMKQITAHSNPFSSFSLSFCPLCIRRGFDEKFCTKLCSTAGVDPRQESISMQVKGPNFSSVFSLWSADVIRLMLDLNTHKSFK